jgi:hypothetical protein
MLFQSLRQHHPEFVLHLLLADEPHPEFDLASEPFDELMTLSELDIPDWRAWAFCHTIVELATAIKPFALKKLLARPDCAAALYIDPDIVVFSRLDDILAALQATDIALTPHQTAPETSMSAIIDNEICSLKHGIYNLGFLGVKASDEGRRFAAWWAERLYHFCRADIPNGLFTDQRWIDFVPAFFDRVTILRSTRFNVSTWNLTTRDMQGSLEAGFLVDGKPLGFYHFTGFDSGAHRIMAEKNSHGNPAVRRLITWYENQTARVANDAMANIPWAFARYSNGDKITPDQRIFYRDRPDIQAAFPAPFDTSGDHSYLRFYQTTVHRPLPEANQAAASPAPSQPMLVPGFRNTHHTLAIGKVCKLVFGLLLRPAYGFTILKRSLVILKKEGWSALVRRVRQRASEQ